VWDSIQRNPKIWKSFCEHFSVMMCENGTASIDDMQTVLNIFHRGVEFKFYDQSPNSIDLRTLNIVQKAMKTWENKWKESGNNSVRCNIADAFGVMRKKVNPYEVPYWATNIMSNIIDKNLSQNDAVDAECKRQNSSKREPIHDESWMKDEFRKRYKWSALNDYLFERVENNREHLTMSEVERVYSIFDKISLPTTLKVTPDFIHYGIGKLTVSETEVIKSNSH